MKIKEKHAAIAKHSNVTHLFLLLLSRVIVHVGNFSLLFLLCVATKMSEHFMIKLLRETQRTDCALFGNDRTPESEFMFTLTSTTQRLHMNESDAI